MQGSVQGVLTGIRGLCQGFGPAVFGFIFYLFDMDLSTDSDETGHLGVGPAFPIPMPKIRMVPFENNRIITPSRANETTTDHTPLNAFFPGPPFLFGALLVFMVGYIHVL
jgi:hypothetical protein